mgnify:CR=1 FL=1
MKDFSQNISNYIRLRLIWVKHYKGLSINYVVSRGEGVKNFQFYLVKRQLRGGKGVKMADFETT